MRTKILLIITLSVLAAFFIVNKYFTDESINNTVINKEEVAQDTNITPVPKTKQPTKSEIKTTIPETKIEPKTPILTDLTYSADPVVNAHTIFKNNQLCYTQLENNNSPSVYMQQFLERMDKKQTDYFENFLKYCEKLNLEHPEYSLTDKDHILAQMKNAKANSLWGKIINKEVEVETLSHIEIQELLRSNDINILQEAPQYLESYYQKVVHWDLESFLGNHDYDYINYIRQYAHQVYLCDLGAQCQANSSIMASMCYRDESSCGLDFPSYINNSLTQGQQADIQLALSYLRSQYQ